MLERKNTMDVHLLYFSPTNTTRRVLRTMFDKQNGYQSIEYNLTDIQFSGIKMTFAKEDVVVFGIPVYSGRVPKAALDRFRKLSGNNTPAILVATYGNRHYDDALIELYDVVKAQGFAVISAAAIVTEHSVVHEIAKGRPNKDDKIVIKEFANKILAKDLLEDLPFVPGNRPYRKYQSIPFKPKGNRKCNDCGSCIKLCPVNAISSENPRHTNKLTCISCMRCVRYCPKKARNLSKIEQYISYMFIAGRCKEQRENVLFI